MLTEVQKEINSERSRVAVLNAKKVLKIGDRLRVTKCPGRQRWITFGGWDGGSIVSKSGLGDFHPMCVDMRNGEPIDFTKSSNA